MNVIIKNSYQGKLPINIEKRVERLLKIVPKKYITGLKMIVLINKISHHKHKDSLGIYCPKTKSELPRIEIAIDKIYQQFPKIFMWAPFFGKYALAKVLYHEIGHHYQIENKDMKKKYKERYAEYIAKELLAKYFFLWKIPLYPLYRILLFVKKSN